MADRRTAKQWRATRWGGPETWEFAEVEVPEPRQGEVTIRVGAAGVNPADYKHVAAPRAGLQLPVPIGYEVAGVLSAIGPDTEIASGGGAVGDAVVAFRIRGGYATEVTVPAKDVFAKPARLSDEEAANLLLAGTTAAQMLHLADVRAGETILVHGASGAVGMSILQQAAEIGARAIGTSSEASFARVRRFGGLPVEYGPGLAERVAEAAQGRIAAALDTVGTDEAIDVSLQLVPDRVRIVTIVAAKRAEEEGFHAPFGAQPESQAFRDAHRAELLELAGSGRLQVPVARTYPLAQAPEALAFLKDGHPGGKLALIP
ncbi:MULTISPECIES: NADP-dependent oxidoreductase [unclassified Leifsonia]|uniref:quinone oxidoreductase family protein n=1 Tax=unclassified Leifsonia TaxID=2663824 RepID=UPI0008A7417D|nr:MULTISPECIES: NADP-dependent oxidoreductase [unclassified Leifsonia]SEH91241.1 NADPH:quinone reductase [Leifsonia sp. CL154]SFL52675.1 NADPH:quinone reductase [Leifsonia sp. CL147]